MPDNIGFMSKDISSRVLAIAESATLAVDAKAKALKAAGRPVIGFGAGEPDFPTPSHIVEAAQKAASEVSNHRYTPTPGLIPLREAIAKSRRSSCCGPGAGVTRDGTSRGLECLQRDQEDHDTWQECHFR